MSLRKRLKDFLGLHYASDVFTYPEFDFEKLKRDIESKNTLEKAVKNMAYPFEKPTAGIKPKYLWEEERLIDLQNVIKNRLEACQSIPNEWIEEYNELAKKYNI